MTYREIGEELGVSHVMARRIEQQALNKLRGHPDVDALAEFLEVLEEENKLDRTIYSNW